MAMRKHLGIISLLFFLVILFYSDVFLHPGYVLTPAYDIYGQYSVWNAILRNAVLVKHVFPFWNLYEFNGTPFIANPLVGIFYPPNLVYLLFSSDWLFGVMFAFDSLMIGLFTFLFAKQLIKGTLGPLISAISFMLSGSVVGRVYAGHIANVNVMVWVVASFFLLERYLQKKKNINLLLLSLTIALTILAGHLQVAFYGQFILFLYILLRVGIEYQKKKNLRTEILNIVKITAAFVAGVFLCSVQLLPTLEFGMHTVRSGGVSFEFASSYSIPLFQLSTILLPDIFGSQSANAWWGRGNFWEFAMYIGVIPIVFAMYSFLKPNKYVAIFATMAFFTILFSMGSYGPVFWFFYRFVPGFNMFRIPATMLYLTSFSLSILAGFGGKVFFDSLKPKNTPVTKTVILLPLLILSISSCVLLTALSNKNIVIGFYAKYLTKFNPFTSGLFYEALFHDLVVIVFLLILLLAISLFKNRVKNKNLLISVIITFIIFDLMLYGKRLIKTVPPVQAESQLNTFVSKNAFNGKILDLDTGTLPQLQKLSVRNVTGYNPNYLSYYRDYLWAVGEHLDTPYEPFVALKDIKNVNLLHMLGAKYVLSSSALNNDSLSQVFKSDDGIVYILKNEVSNAFVIHEAKIVSDQKTAILTISHKNFDERKELVLEKTPTVPIQNEGQFRDVKVNVLTNEIRASIVSQTSGFFVIREVWYPGWKAYVNGREVPIYRANAIFRAIPIKAGINNIKLVYYPLTFKIGFFVSLVSLIGVLLYLLKNYNIRKLLKRHVFSRQLK